MSSVQPISLEELRATAINLLDTLCAPAGQFILNERHEALLALAVRASVAGLNAEGVRAFAERALDLGATANQVHDTIVLVSGLGVHSLMVGSRELAALLRERGDSGIDAPVDERRRRLWEDNVGNKTTWAQVEEGTPGFLDALLRLSPEAFEAFFAYCAVPWRARSLPAVMKELIALATDATPGHRFLPGVKMHLVNAVGLGAGRGDLLSALDIAAAAPGHDGIGSLSAFCSACVAGAPSIKNLRPC